MKQKIVMQLLFFFSYVGIYWIVREVFNILKWLPDEPNLLCGIGSGIFMSVVFYIFTPWWKKRKEHKKNIVK